VRKADALCARWKVLRDRPLDYLQCKGEVSQVSGRTLMRTAIGRTYTHPRCHSTTLFSTAFKHTPDSQAIWKQVSARSTFRSLEDPLDARMLSFCSSCTMRPQKRLNVRGNRTCGLTSMSTFLAVCT
jgi:hypothetical protein